MTLSSDTLQKLAVDRRLGELSDDAAALLDAYLVQNPAAADSMTLLDDTLNLAAAAMTVRDPVRNAPLPAPAFLRAVTRAKTTMRFRDGLIGFALAASIALVVLVGLDAPSTAPTRSAHGIFAQTSSLDAESQSPGFWSRSTLRRDAAKPRANRSSTLKWTGPITRPKIGA